MAATFATDGALDVAQGGNDTGAACTGIGVGSNNSGTPPPGNFTSDANDFVARHIGGAPNDAVAPSSLSASNTGQVVNPAVTVTPGSGYTNGTYRVQSNASGGQPAGAAEIEFVIAGGALTTARVVRPGSGFTGAPTFTVANAINTNGTGAGPGAGTLGALVVAVGLASQAWMLGAAFGANKNTQRLTAVGAVAIDAAVTPSTYLNRSGRAMVAGDSTWAVEP
jgi:hypothetical protein